MAITLEQIDAITYPVWVKEINEGDYKTWRNGFLKVLYEEGIISKSLLPKKESSWPEESNG